ncbi:MAG: glycosyltransferase family 4 protein [Candidatus Rokuibacteriota bacterium]
MRVLVLSSTFPSAMQPNLGVFVRERMRRVAERCEVVVVAPVPWFPFNGMIRGARWDAVPAVERQYGLAVYHPRFLSIPRYLKWLDGFLYACSLVPFLRRLRKEFPFDLIDAHFAYPDGLAARVLGKIFRRPVMITVRGSIVRLSRSWPHRLQMQWALGGAAGVVTVSQSLKQLAMRLGLAEWRIRVISNGVDSRVFQPRDRALARRACGLAGDRRVVLTVGGIYEDKGQHLVLEALPQILARHPAFLYVMIGEMRRDRYRARLDALIERHGLQRHVLFAGGRPHQELAHWYAASDLFCLATRSEGWANVLLEALACGVPVVSTDVGGNPEIVGDERLGLLVPYGDRAALTAAILRALGTEWDRSAMAAYARRHSWDRVADDVTDEMSRVLSLDTGTLPSVATAATPSRR